MALCMGMCPDHGPGWAEARAVLSALCSAGGEACCGQPARLSGRHGEGGEVPAEVLGQTADAAAPALVSVPRPRAQPCGWPPLRGKCTPPAGRAPDSHPRGCRVPLPIPLPPRALGRSAALPDAPVVARPRGDALGGRGDGGPHAWPSTPELPFSRLFPSAYGTLTVRSLLDTREHCLNEFNFPDPYSKVSAA